MHRSREFSCYEFFDVSKKHDKTDDCLDGNTNLCTASNNGLDRVFVFILEKQHHGEEG